MKKIIFLTRKLHTGGIEKALLQTINLIKNDNIEISVAAIDATGDLSATFNSCSKIIDLSKVCKKAQITKSNFIENLKKFKILTATGILIKFLFEKLFYSYNKRQEKISKRVPILNEEYDIAVAYHVPYYFITHLTLNNVKAKQKLLWIHTDISTSLKNHDVSDYDNVFNKFDKVICVSKSAEESFLNRHPLLKGKTEVIYNPIDLNRVKTLSKESTEFDNVEKIKICTVGRLDKAKGYNLAISACKILKDKGYNVLWYVCGEGAEREYLTQLINENNLVNDFILLGNQSNPYKYINSADIYVQTSIYESYCITLAEAKILQKQIVTTNFPCSHEHIIDGENGLICEMSGIAIANSIERIIRGFKANVNNNKHAIDNQKLIKLFN